MSKRDELTEALHYGDLHKRLSALVPAAQQLLDFPTDEQVETVAKAEDAFIASAYEYVTAWSKLDEDQRKLALDCARAGLEALRDSFFQDQND